MLETLIGIAIHVALEIALIVRVLTRPNRDPESRIAWVLLIAGIPILGMLVYLMFGEVNIGKSRVANRKKVIDALPSYQAETSASSESQIPDQYHQLFSLGRSISGLGPVGGNSATLLADSNATITSMIADIDAATKRVHLLFYIWLPDNNGLKMVEALKRAAGRGVKCRAMADALGSRTIIASDHWREMQAAGVALSVVLPTGIPVLHALFGRFDLRNHRKILTVDGAVTYCGSQNCADPEFLVKAKYAPWVDAVARFEGPIVRQNEYLFARDWISQTGEEIGELLVEPHPFSDTGFLAEVIGTGPTVRHSAMPEVFECLIFSSRKKLVISTPYFIPNEAVMSALRSAAYRGVDVTMIFPAVNDSWVVGGASRSYYADLLESGVKIFEYIGGLLHTKSLTVDGEVGLIGSSNMDRRSFDLNYENNILFHDVELTRAIGERQDQYLASSQPVLKETVASWPLYRRLWNNTLAMLGPIL